MRTVQATVVATLLAFSVLLTALPVSAQTPYTSSTFGYSVTLPAGWTVDSDTTQSGTDTLRFSNEDVVAFLTSYTTDQTPTECIEEAVETIEARPQHDNFAFAQPVAEENGKATAVFGYTFVTAAGEELEGRNRMTCWALPEAGAMVRLEFLLLERDLTAQSPAIAEVEAAVETALAPMTSGESSGVGAATPITEEDAAPEAATATATTEPATAVATPSVPTPSPSPAESQEEAPIPAGTGVNGNTYVSPTYGYGLTWSDAWTVSGEESDARGDYLGLEHVDGVFADLIGEAYPQGGNCFDFIATYYANHADYTDVVPSPDATSAAPGLWDFTGMLTMTGITQSGTELEIVNYLACSQIPGQSSIVSLEQSTIASLFDQVRPEMDALRQGFAISATGQTGTTTVEPAATATSQSADPAASPESGTATTATGPSGVTDTSYVSPTYGYRLFWDAAWTVDGESSEGGRDYLALTNGAVYAELLSEPWDATQGNCFEWIVAFYTSNPDYTDVRASQDAVSAVPGVWDITGAIAMTDVNATSNAERINYVACSEIPGQDAIVSLEQFVFPIDAPGQLNAMDTLRESFSLS